MSKKLSSWLTRFSKTLSENTLFAMRYLKSPKEVGTPFRCSAAVAKSILTHVPVPHSTQPPRRYLEVGPGTGIFTEHFVKRLNPHDRLDLVEIDEGFCTMLRQKFSHYPNVHVHHLPIEKWHPDYQYDLIVSAVPFNALPSEAALQTILEAYRHLLKKGGVLSSVEYVGTATTRKTFLKGDKKERFDRLLGLKKQFFNEHGISQEIVWQNLPPARVTHFRL